jgi:hypothetical protein
VGHQSITAIHADYPTLFPGGAIRPLAGYAIGFVDSYAAVVHTARQVLFEELPSRMLELVVDSLYEQFALGRGVVLALGYFALSQGDQCSEFRLTLLEFGNAFTVLLCPIGASE